MMKNKKRPLSVKPNDVKVYLDVKTKFCLHEGIHIQHPNGKYTYWQFKFPATYKVILESNMDGGDYLHEVEKVEVKE